METLPHCGEGKIRCGGRGFRTYRRACPAANGLSRISRGSPELLDGIRCWSRFDVRLSEIEWCGDQCYPLSTQCLGSILQVLSVDAIS